MRSFKLLSLSLTLCSIALRAPAGPAGSNMLVGIEAIKAHFAQSGLVPTFLPKFTPSALLSVSFKVAGKIAAGQVISREQALYEPILTLIATNTSATHREKYTVMMVDVGPPGANQGQGQRRHWLVNGATISVTTNSNVSMVGATVITKYIPPNPPVGGGPHRYVVLVFAQPADFLAPPDLSKSNTGGGIFMVEEYVKFARLGDPVAASYFTCQRGRATITIPPTKAVVSETLSGWKDATRPTGAVEQKVNSGLSTTRNALVLLLAPIMGFLAL